MKQSKLEIKKPTKNKRNQIKADDTKKAQNRKRQERNELKHSNKKTE